MTEQLYGTIAESKPDNLIADISFPLQTGSAVIAASAGALFRGTLLGKNIDGEFVMASEEVEADCILSDDVVVESESKVVVVYVSGSFSQSALIAENEIKNHKDALRTKGIYVKATIGGE